MRVGLIQSAEDLNGTKQLSKRDPLQPDCMGWDTGLFLCSDLDWNTGSSLVLRLKAFGLEFIPLALLILQSLDLVRNYMSALLVLQFADCSYQALIGSSQTLIEKPIPNNKEYTHTHTHTHTHIYLLGLLRWLSDKECTCQGKGWNVGSILGSGRFPGGENGNKLQYSCLKNPIDRGAW